MWLFVLVSKLSFDSTTFNSNTVVLSDYIVNLEDATAMMTKAGIGIFWLQLLTAIIAGDFLNLREKYKNLPVVIGP